MRPGKLVSARSAFRRKPSLREQIKRGALANAKDDLELAKEWFLVDESGYEAEANHRWRRRS